ncbi:MAG TPA: chemotaxis-specific protein-glutamate methyltransferase CheB [Anaeromyxobacteraceae bacterium]|nr:chemotaxis-specific protein-glutamate methyltransferase CheB [Anaeromyxobacteraceae bacterium]
MRPPDTRPPRRPIRVMVVDDSESSRAAIASILRSDPGVEVLLSTGDAEEALRRAFLERPDAICLDLEMPGMDGYTFMRLLMARQPTPVIMVSSNTRRQDVFKALELGAFDFISKPERGGDLTPIRGELLAKIATVRALRMENLEAQAARGRQSAAAAPTPAPAPLQLAVIGASTGGPSAVTRLLGLLPAGLPLAVAVVQHMPEKFTRTFAERLDRTTGFHVREAEDGDTLSAGRVLIAPGGRHLRIVRQGPRGLGALRANVVERQPDDPRYCPSVDLLFESAADAWGDRVCGVVLTGMGNDGRAGVRAVKAAGGITIAESETSAVVYGMPKEAVESGHVDEVLSLERIAERLARFAARGGTT